jgi:hypothetical protein
VRAGPATIWWAGGYGKTKSFNPRSTREQALANGLEIVVTGQGRTLGAIKRMVPAHAQELAGLGWSARTQELPNGMKLVVTTSDPRAIVKLKALGFIGIMAQGAHHQAHHLLMAKGEFAH